MSPRFRKVALIAASLGLLLSLFLALRPQDEETVSTTTVATTTTAPASTATATTSEPPPATTAPTPPPPRPPSVVRIAFTVTSANPGEIRRFSVKKGRKVAMVVRSDLSDHVHLHGYDLMADVAPGSPARIQFVADTPGRFEMELEDRGLQIADLEVRP